MEWLNLFNMQQFLLYIKIMNAKILDLIDESISFKYIRSNVSTIHGPVHNSWFTHSAGTQLSQPINSSVSMRLEDTNKTHIIRPMETCFPPKCILRISKHHGSRPITFRWARVKFSIFGDIDFLDFFDTPVVIKSEEGKELGEINAEYTELTDEQNKCKDINSIVAVKKLGFRQLELILRVSTPRINLNDLLDEQQRYSDIFDFIEQNYRENLTVEMLAKKASLSVSRFHCIFKTLTNTSPLQYLNQRKIQEAEKLLFTTTLSIAEIAAHLNYSCQFCFSRSFKKYTGISPSEFRNNKNLH